MNEIELLQKENQKFERFFELSSILSKQNDFQEILRLVSAKTAALVNADIASVVMLNPKTQQTIKTVIRDGSEEKSNRYQLVHANVIGWMMRYKMPFLSTDIHTDSRFEKDAFTDAPARSIASVPLRLKNDIIGYLLVINNTADKLFNEKDLKFLEKMVVIAAPYLSNAQEIQEYFQPPLPDAALLNKYEALGLLGKSHVFLELLKAIEAASRCDVRVLLEGRTGTGKELVARAVHKLSARNSRSFMAIDCGAIPQNLIESELFGHVKGAFTGANRDRVGLFTEANHGTLFMDEIANLPLEMQSKLLRVLQEGEIRPLGSNRTQKVDVRIISASSISLYDMVGKNQFREDLYYRLLVYPISIPSLDERREDITLLANHFLKKFSRQQKKKVTSFHEEIVEFMLERNWSGNIRELENFIERLVALADERTTVLKRAILPINLQSELKDLKYVYDDTHIPESLSESLADYEEQLIRQALIKHDWNQSRAARSLKIPVQTIRYKINKLSIEKSDDA